MRLRNAFVNGLFPAESVARYSLPIHAFAVRTLARRRLWKQRADVSANDGYPEKTARNLRRAGVSHNLQEEVMEIAFREGRVRLTAKVPRAKPQERPTLIRRALKYAAEAEEIRKKRSPE